VGRRATSWLLVLGTAVVLAAAPGRAAGPSPGVVHYRAHANAICRAFGRWTPPPGSAKVQLTALNRRFRKVVASLSALKAPPSLTKLRTQVVSILRQEMRFLDTELALFKAGKITPRRFEQDIDGASYATTENGLWHEIGANACASVH
jgi:hypothetical protein